VAAGGSGWQLVAVRGSSWQRLVLGGPCSAQRADNGSFCSVTTVPGLHMAAQLVSRAQEWPLLCWCAP
jgi:hypothetical protein